MPKRQPEPRYLAIGQVLRPHGVRGELRTQILTDYPERVGERSHVYVGPQLKRYEVEGVRFHKGAMLLRLRGVGDREAAEQLRDQLVQIPAEEASPLEEDEYYLHQVLGMEVETEEGEPLGEVVEVLSPPDANDVFIVHGLRGELLIPSIEEVILELDLEEGRMVVRPLPGLFGEED